MVGDEQFPVRPPKELALDPADYSEGEVRR
jgi:hypothetical protein